MGSMLRECVRFEPLAKIILNDEGLFRDFFVYVQDPQFDIQADAFATTLRYVASIADSHGPELVDMANAQAGSALLGNTPPCG